MRETSLSALIGHMKLIGENPKLANRAFTEFHLQLGKNVIGLCRRICWRSPLTANSETAEDLSQETFIKFFMSLRLFNERMYPDDDSLKSGVMSWILRIATQKHIDILKKLLAESEHTKVIAKNYRSQFKRGSRELVSPSEKVIFIKAFGEQGIKINQNQYLQSIKTLPTREQEILMTYMLYYPHLPPRLETRALAKKFGIKTDSVRGIKKRAFDTMKKAVFDLIKKTAIL